jgi:hypothetical protein
VIRPTLADLRRQLLLELDDQWRTPTEIAHVLGLGHGIDWLKVALVLERLAHEGVVEIANPRSRGKRWFRRAA